MRKWAAQLLFSTNCCTAVVLALYLAFLTGLQRPYWAMATVYIVSQPLSGAMRSKAIYRSIRTLVGGAAVVFPQHPVGSPAKAHAPQAETGHLCASGSHADVLHRHSLVTL